MEQLKIEAPPDDLEALRAMLRDELGDAVDVEEMGSQGIGELREPILIALVIALGGPKLTRAVAGVIDRWMTHRERLRELDVVELSLLRDSPQRITVETLKAGALP